MTGRGSRGRYPPRVGATSDGEACARLAGCQPRHRSHPRGALDGGPPAGIDDYGPDETFTKAEAPSLLTWAQSKKISTLSFWALQRDNGGCPGTKGAGTCSGISQPTWYFSHQFEPFTG